MPSGRVHLRVETAALLALAVIAALLVSWGRVRWLEAVAFLGAYAFSAYLLSPDLDLAASDATRRWGIARILWRPYAKWFRHRRVSHRPLLGPLSRIVYLGGLLLLGALLVSRLGGPRLRAPWPSWTVVAATLAGLYLPNLVHIALDRCASAVGRWRR